MKQDPSEITMEQLETEINRLGRVGVSLEANNQSSFPTSSAFFRNTDMSITRAPDGPTGVAELNQFVGTTARERSNKMQCGKLAQAFAQCVKRSSDLGICANEREVRALP